MVKIMVEILFKILFEILLKIFQFLKNYKESYPRIFWLCIFFLAVLSFQDYNQDYNQDSNESQIVIQKIRGGSKDSKADFDVNFHRRLREAFPDWKARMDYQKKQEEFYKSAMKKREERTRIKVLNDSRYFTAQELDAMDYFHGTGVYAILRNPKTKPNILDTRETFLLKMHDDELNNEFLKTFNSLNSLNRRNDKTI
jgi:hypothetical protein